MSNHPKQPRLIPPCPGWQEDLPHPDSAPSVAAFLDPDNPNHLCAAYLELSRSPHHARGLMLYLTISASAFLIFLGLVPVPVVEAGTLENAFIVIVDLLLVWMVAFGVRVDIAPPRDLPLRFNRARQRVYAYNFQYRWWNPFERWRVAAVSYDWSQVRAERWKLRGVTAQGALIIKWGVVLSIVEPGTNKVVDRFPLSTMGADEFAWSYICTYMQQGPEALPPPGAPRDHDDVPWYNLALRVAPKVNWPAGMDLESRSRP
ncbi:DUF6708 domain-containing protein [Achromobacter animicus]|uniref:DUF6708 domain-containing protein n=1 Tax=Achromobacter animicus TaxID=1389935 RepID=UPI0028A5F530|nr:DUF6708 domain-containing protein [Achromobacter animicus]